MYRRPFFRGLHAFSTLSEIGVKIGRCSLTKRCWGWVRKNENRDYTIQGAILECVTQEKDRGVVIDTEG